MLNFVLQSMLGKFEWAPRNDRKSSHLEESSWDVNYICLSIGWQYQQYSRVIRYPNCRLWSLFRPLCRLFSSFRNLSFCRSWTFRKWLGTQDLVTQLTKSNDRIYKALWLCIWPIAGEKMDMWCRLRCGVGCSLEPSAPFVFQSSLRTWF